MKNLVFTIVTVATLATFAEKPPFDLHQKPKDEAERLARKAYFEKKIYERTGGPLVRPNTQAGEIVYVNCQTRADKAWVEESIAYFTKVTKFKISQKMGGSFDFKNPKIEGNASLYIVDDAALPPLLVAPESRWAVVNVAKLSEGEGAKPQFFEARVKKELTRGFAALCGAMRSNYPQSLTGGVAKAADLDTFRDHILPVDVIARFPEYMEVFGVKPAVVSNFRKACQEGWAPNPTNDVQKKIWDEVHAIPTKPIKIEFDPKRDAGK